MPLTVNTSDNLYGDFLLLIFLHTHRESSDLSGELPEESDQFRFLRTDCLTHLKGSPGCLILSKASGMRIPIPSTLSTYQHVPSFTSLDSERPGLAVSSPSPHSLVPSLLSSPPSCPFRSSIPPVLCLSVPKRQMMCFCLYELQAILYQTS